jgi:hypothetical protein
MEGWVRPSEVCQVQPNYPSILMMQRFDIVSDGFFIIVLWLLFAINKETRMMLVGHVAFASIKVRMSFFDEDATVGRLPSVTEQLGPRMRLHV